MPDINESYDAGTLLQIDLRCRQDHCEICSFADMRLHVDDRVRDVSADDDIAIEEDDPVVQYIPACRCVHHEEALCVKPQIITEVTVIIRQKTPAQYGFVPEGVGEFDGTDMHTPCIERDPAIVHVQQGAEDRRGQCGISERSDRRQRRDSGAFLSRAPHRSCFPTDAVSIRT